MTRKKLLMLLGSVCLALMLAVPMVVACAAPAPTPTPTPTPTLTPTPTPSPPPEEKVYEWRLQIFKGPGDYEYENLPIFVERLKEMSDGRIDITYYPAGTVVPTLELVESVAAGVVEMGLSCPSYLKGLDEAFVALWGLPFGVSGVEMDNQLYWNYGLMDLARDIYAEQGVYCIGIVPICPYGAMMSNVPIYGPDDMKGVKVRNHGMYEDICNAMGASVVYLVGEELYTALATGVIDATMWGGPGAFWAMKFHEVTKYLTRPDWAYPLHNDLYMDMDVWNTLPDDIKEILVTANRLRGLEVVSAFSLATQTVIGPMQTDYGIELCQWDDEAMSKASEIALVEWDKLAAQSPNAKKVVDMIKAFMKDANI